MSERPKDICYIKPGVYDKITCTSHSRIVFTEKTGCKTAFMSKEEYQKFDEWVNLFEDTAHCQDELDEAILACKAYYGDKKFNELFDHNALSELHDNWMDIALWESSYND